MVTPWFLTQEAAGTAVCILHTNVHSLPFEIQLSNMLRCEEGIKAKFFQNSDLRDYLLGTGDKRIAECCSDKLWGNGIPLHDENCIDPSKWQQQGLLGEILENIRVNINDIMGMNNKSPKSTSELNNTAMDLTIAPI